MHVRRSRSQSCLYACLIATLACGGSSPTAQIPAASAARSNTSATHQHDRSPGYFVDRIERPLLVVQGDKDARVKKDQSDRIVDALKKRNVPVHYLVLENEGHGFSKNENYLAAYKTTDRFLDRYIHGDTSVEVK